MVNVVLETTKGNIEIELFEGRSPITVQNFLAYVKEGHFNGTIFHRVISNFMIQGGGYTFDGKEKKVSRKPIMLESKNGVKNDKYTIAMARTDQPNSATAQFFINVTSNSSLNYSPSNPGYAAFGEVVSGKEVVDEIKKVKTKRNGMHDDWPVEAVVINKAYLKV
ncbi:MAG: peptidylprolyl isomerase [Candidatus Micrarchaeota archaeon]